MKEETEHARAAIEMVLKGMDRVYAQLNRIDAVASVLSDVGLTNSADEIKNALSAIRTLLEIKD